MFFEPRDAILPLDPRRALVEERVAVGKLGGHALGALGLEVRVGVVGVVARGGRRTNDGKARVLGELVAGGELPKDLGVLLYEKWGYWELLRDLFVVGYWGVVKG